MVELIVEGWVDWGGEKVLVASRVETYADYPDHLKAWMHEQAERKLRHDFPDVVGVIDSGWRPFKIELDD